MILIILYLILFLIIVSYSLLSLLIGWAPLWIEPLKLPISCILTGGIGGIIYCLRAVYLNACVRQSWDKKWLPWYFIRPFVSLACGGISFVFLRAGLLVLESAEKNDATSMGFLALAFISGLNVDKFISKLEDLAQAAWGIEKSRASSISEKE